MIARVLAVLALSAALAGCGESGAGSSAPSDPPQTTEYPWHYDIVATNFFVGEVIGSGPNDSQEISAYDPHWMANYGGCDGIRDANGVCRTDALDRSAANGWFPTRMTPLQNPFYLDLPVSDPSLKNRWVQLVGAGGTCYGQIQDAGPLIYDDYDYVFGAARPRNTTVANGAAMDVSPAFYGCLGFSGGVDGASDKVNWRFVEFADVPAGPWTRIITQ